MRFKHSYSAIKHSILVIILSSIVGLRLWVYFSNGYLVAEDCRIFFTDAYNLDWTESFLKPYAGYFHLLPRILAELLSLFQLEELPYIYGAVAVLLNALIFSSFYHPDFRSTISSDQTRLFTCILFALAPNAENLGLILGLHWYLAFLLTLILLRNWNGFKGRLLNTCIVTVVTIWSSPAVFIFIPMFFWKLLRPQCRKERYWSIIAIINYSVVISLIIWLRLANPERTGSFDPFELFIASERLFIRGWLGVSLLGSWIGGLLAPSFILTLISVLILSTTTFYIWVLHKNSHQTKDILFLLISALLMVSLTFSRSIYISHFAATQLPDQTRYLTTPTLLLLLSVTTVMSRIPDINIHVRSYIMAIISLFLISGIHVDKHQSIEFTHFNWLDTVQKIRNFESSYRTNPQPMSFFIPSELPYWSGVLEKEGGSEIITAENDVILVLNARLVNTDRYDSWMGKFVLLPDKATILHDYWGPIKFSSVAKGLYFFEDVDGYTIFTAKSTYPIAWKMDHLNPTMLLPENPR